MENERFNKKRVIENIVIGSGLICVFIIFFLGSMTVYKLYIENRVLNEVSTENKETLTMINEALNMLDSKYIDIDEVTKNDLVIGAVKGIMDSVGDPYTRFIDSEEFKEILVPNVEEFFGIGVNVVYDSKTEGILVLSTIAGGDAMTKGIKSEDVIIKVDDIVLSKDTYKEAVDAIKGEENTTVNLVVYRAGEVLNITCVRKKIVVNDIEANVLENNIGYVKISEFSKDISASFKKEYEEIASKNDLKGLIIDLRNNPGGNLDEVVDIADYILPKGEIVRVKYIDKQDKVYLSKEDSKIDLPIVLLVNGNSASASEILTGAIKDLNYGTIVGTTTFGKGIVQSVEPLKSGIGALSITNAKYYTASLVEIHGNGIAPHIEVKLDDKYENSVYVPFENDKQLQKAIEIIKKS